jgi:hypothetical protein
VKVEITFGFSPGPQGSKDGFWIWQQVQGGPASGVGNIAWTQHEPIAEMIVEALTKHHRATNPWACPHCDQKHLEKPKSCTYCGRKPE